MVLVQDSVLKEAVSKNRIVGFVPPHPQVEDLFYDYMNVHVYILPNARSVHERNSITPMCKIVT